MTFKIQEQVDRHLSKILREDTSYPISVGVHHAVQGRGHYLWLSNKNTSLPIDPAPALDVRHFIGVHQCMCLTIRRPSRINSLLKVSKELPTVDPFGRIIWLGAIRILPPKKGFPNCGNRAYIPKTIWDPRGSQSGSTYRTTGVVHTYHAKNGKDQFEYVLLELPAFQGDSLLPSYLTTKD